MYDDSNIFAKILSKELSADIVAENEHTMIIKDKYPDAPIHNLVLCKGKYVDLKHFLNKASAQEKLAFLDAIQDELNKIEGGAKVQINIGADGGQFVFHLHAHILGGVKKDVD